MTSMLCAGVVLLQIPQNSDEFLPGSLTFFWTTFWIKKGSDLQPAAMPALYYYLCSAATTIISDNSKFRTEPSKAHSGCNSRRRCLRPALCCWQWRASGCYNSRNSPCFGSAHQPAIRAAAAKAGKLPNFTEAPPPLHVRQHWRKQQLGRHHVQFAASFSTVWHLKSRPKTTPRYR